MKCLRCGNTDPVYFYQDQDVWYCRKCIAFGRVNVNELPPRKQYQRKRHTCHPQLKYPLTPAQKKASDELRRNLTLKQDSLVFACCGAGKTEIVMEAIADYLAMGKKVGFAISRRQVVLEIAERMQEAFPSLSVIAVCEGYTDIVDGDLIICTMHQLYRYHQNFDLLIMDEVDAFPYRGNAILKAIAMHACVGEKIYLTATPDDEMRKEVSAHHLNMVELFQRPHGYPLIVPEVKRGYSWMQITYLLLFLKSPRPSLPLKRAPPLTPTLSPSGEREETALLGARNRYALRLAGHQSPRHLVRAGTAWGKLVCCVSYSCKLCKKI